jgi:hypothetical protein
VPHGVSSTCWRKDAIDDLSVARRSLDAFRAEGVPFDDAWRIVVGALAVREVSCAVEDRDRASSITALEALEPQWRACYCGTAEPRGAHWQVGALFDPDLDSGKLRPQASNGHQQISDPDEIRKLLGEPPPARGRTQYRRRREVRAAVSR